MPFPFPLAIDVTNGDGTHARWGYDEPKAENAPYNLSFTTTMPGGFEQMNCTLTRLSNFDYPDLGEFTKVQVYGAGGEPAWEGRLQTSPRTSGDQLAITPGAVGYQAALDDDNSARMIWIDTDLTKWQGDSAGRTAVINNSFVVANPQVAPMTGGMPALQNVIRGPWAVLAIVESFYDGNGIPIGSVGYAWTRMNNVSAADTNWNWIVFISSDGLFTTNVNTGNLRAAGPGVGTLTDPAKNKTWAAIQFYYSVAAGGNSDYEVDWTNLSVIGAHGLTLRGTLGANPGACGFFASDVIQYAVQRWVPELAISRAGISTIEATSFIIPQLEHLNPTTAGTMINDVLLYEIDKDWWVDEGPTFNMASRANHGRDWRARVGPSGLQETGPDATRICNRVMITYNDVTGVTRTVGPPGSGANTIDSSLEDDDPTNPCNVAGIIRYPPTPPPNIGTSTPAAAIQVGKRFLSEEKQRNTAGQASLNGYVEDSSGILWPSWMVRSGDRITFTDAHDPVPRRIVKTNFNDSTKSNQIDLDSPSQDLDATIARLGASIVGLL